MGVWSVTLQLVLLLGYASAGLNGPRAPVFLERQAASQVMLPRQKRANAGEDESKTPPSLERECLQEICNYEEAREIFQDAYRTDIFWSVYIDGDQCAEQPCKNGAMCSDSVGGYDCVCKAGFSGVHCESDQTGCVVDDSKGCSQFCKPGYQSYECSCARGWKLQQREKCVPAATFPCGKVGSLSQWENRQSSNIRNGYQGLACNAEECPWQALLRNSGSGGFCSGVILKENLVLTTAECASKHSDFQVLVGKRLTSQESGEQTMYVRNVHTHPRYVGGRADYDLALLELRDKMIFRKSVLAACLPERDFADTVLLAGKYMGVVTGWSHAPGATEVTGQLTLNHLSYETLDKCVERFNGQVTNKVACSLPREKADCVIGPGSPVLTLYREVFFLTGVISPAPEPGCRQGYVMQKVSRYMNWLKPLVDSL
ncbi:protein Z, vitamin K-dependent plasma glycoprotein a [Clupea harengus]|uniref:Protein Z, vitamin K-dependent plasma glycoprotein a n=1 Tax=Clupea harengus TaxID=7950 RepID=A0A8M1KCE9_CLUHA|nr:protein Z, vitamin K-dependent plasma glycoprotein a [Clupea harengus]XP_042559954.1 protein Z, vitamin K-dependent plasma glycoprotein a [Clupea harengus]